MKNQADHGNEASAAVWLSNTQGVGHRGHEAGGAPAGAAGGPAVRRRVGVRADLEGGWGPEGQGRQAPSLKVCG